VKSQYFFYIKKVGLKYLAPTAKTAIQFRNDEFFAAQVKNAANANSDGIAVNTLSSVPGVFGFGKHGNFTSNGANVSLDCRAMTLEGFFKVDGINPQDQMYHTWHLAGTNYSHSLYLNPVNGNVQITWASQSYALDKLIPGGIPTDGSYHHLAMVHDPSRGYGQLLFVVDGEVKQTFDFSHGCPFNGQASFGVNAEEFAADEVKITREALYEFPVRKEANLSPTIVNQTIANNMTVQSLPVTLSYVLDDDQAITDEGTELWINGVKQTQMVLSGKGLQQIFSGSVADLGPGANYLLLKVRDSKGDESVFVQRIYYFSQGPAAAYESDDFTLALYHFDELAGATEFADSSSNGLHIPTSGWSFGEEGQVFGNDAHSTYSGQVLNYSGISQTAYTLESWVKGGPTAIVSWELRGLGVHGDGRAILNGMQGGPNLLDGEYHHIAGVADSSHPREQVYLLVDGFVVASQWTADFAYHALPTSMVNLFVGSEEKYVDELRISTAARYELNSTR